MRYGISYESKDGRIKIAVPESNRGWYRLADFAVLGILILYATASSIQLVRTIQADIQAGRSVDLFSTSFNTIVALALGLAAWFGVREWTHRSRRQTVFELGNELFTLHDQDGRGKPRTRMWRRQFVSDIQPGPVPWTAPAITGLGLHIRITGKTILEVMPGHDPQVAHWVANQLNAAQQAWALQNN
jgi:hypothetical protein